jgi:two-component system response regulator PilR (NtrC family)
MTKPTALIVDDEPDILELLEITLKRMGIQSIPASNLQEARARLREQPFDLCLTDMKLPDGDGLDLIAFIQDNYASMPVAMITAHGNMESAIQALKSGAFDFVSKPVDLEMLRGLVATALKLSENGPERQSRLIGESALMLEIRVTIGKLARSQAPVYISGESGTGKEMVARLIHEQGPRADKPFVPVNCGAIPAELIESELFGHKKGAFTGAVADKQGLFMAADGGTLFLDEVAELPLHLQVKLLRAIQEKSIRPVGAETEVRVDSRVLSATHKDLASLVKRGEFREDLYYRINVIELKVPALRERAEDVLPLVENVLLRLAAENDTEPRELEAQAVEALQHYAFPGNVRELENIIERAMTLADGVVIRLSDLRLPKVDGESPGDGKLGDYLDEVERDRIQAALAQAQGNKTAAAKLLGISFRALRYRLEKLGLR